MVSAPPKPQPRPVANSWRWPERIIPNGVCYRRISDVLTTGPVTLVYGNHDPFARLRLARRIDARAPLPCPRCARQRLVQGLRQVRANPKGMNQ